MLNPYAKIFAAAFGAALLSGCAAMPAANSATSVESHEPVTIQIIGINDFHGNLEPLGRPSTIKHGDGSDEKVQVGGAAALSALISDTRATNPYSMIISAGDMISASPLVSSLFLDEPSITAMSRIGVDFNAVGNHEFDRGWRELKRMQDGGCAKLALREPCQVEEFKGASFKFLAANVTFGKSGETLFPASGIRRFETPSGEVTVGVIGLTLKDTPTLVTPSGVDDLVFSEEATAINAQIPALIEQGADALVVAIHQGLYSDLPYDAPGCEGINGPLLDILAQVDPRVDLVITGHTHQFYICDYSTIDPSRKLLVTSAGYGGSFITDIALTIDPAKSDVVAAKAHNILVRADGSTIGKLDAAMGAYVSIYAEAARDAGERIVGHLSAGSGKPSSTEESSFGNLIADAQLAATSDAGAQIAFMNPSGIRAGITPADDGSVSFGDIYAAQPFGNTLVTKSFTGTQLLALLEQQFDDQGFVQLFAASHGFAMRFDMSRPIGSRVISASLDGVPIAPATIYRVTMNSFLAAGGDSFTVFTDGTDPATGPLDLDAMEIFFAGKDKVEMPATGRMNPLD
ncbi:MAG: bifunctional metallophosphatase/5'-nucleotidase [Pontixanthobacter sp.]